MKAIQSLLMIVISVVTLSAQVVIPQLVIQDDGVEKNVEMTDLDVKVTVIGGIARTTFDMTFHNSMNRVMEGRFILPLAEGQQVAAFALDVNGEMREGVVVEKEKGRVVFEEIVRRGVDPGLLEKSEGNVYKARVYPVPARGTKRIRITTEEELVGSERGLRYSLPFDTTVMFKSFSLRAEVHTNEHKPIPEKRGETLFFNSFQKAWVAEKSHSNYSPKGAVTFFIPDETGSRTVQTGIASDGSRYFYLRTRFDSRTERKIWPDTVTLLWDRSGSADFAHSESIHELLIALFSGNSGISTVELVPFHRITEKPLYFNLKGTGVPDLLKTASELPSDGATSLGAIDLTKMRGGEVILVSDGMSNFGSDSIVTGGKTISVITKGTRANHAFLKHLSRNSGGSYINLEKQSLKEALTLLQNQSVHCIEQRFSKGSIRQMYSSIYPEKGIYTVAGKLSGSEAELELAFGIGTKKHSSITVPIVLEKEDSTHGDLIARLWAQRKVEGLAASGGDRRDEIVELAEQFSLVTDHTSLIVLETVEDYVRYEIVPPLSLQEQYFARLKNIRRDEEREKDRAVERVLTKLDQRINWWEKEFDPDGCGRKAEKKALSIGSGAGASRSMGVAESFEEEAVLGYMDNPSPMALMDADEELHELQAAVEGMPGESRGRLSKAKEKKGDGRSVDKHTTSISIKKWTPDVPYVNEIKNAEHPYRAYLKAKEEYGSSPAFYLDVAHLFDEMGKRELAITILSNIAEMDVENHQLLRVLGYRLSQYKEYDMAVFVFKRLTKLRAEEPQSWRDLGLALEKTGAYQEAAENLYKVVIGTWDGRFSDVDIITLNELNSLVARANGAVNTTKFDERLLKNLPVDIRVTLTWDADLTDMDLWVIDPKGEKCFYSNRNTCIGGYMSQDFTQGYGPEEFILKNAIPGKYQIMVNYYGSGQQYLTGAVTLKISLGRNFGREDQVEEETMVRLESRKDVIEVGEFIVK